MGDSFPNQRKLSFPAKEIYFLLPSMIVLTASFSFKEKKRKETGNRLPRSHQQAKEEKSQEHANR
jgi:hypothetical protein